MLTPLSEDSTVKIGVTTIPLEHLKRVGESSYFLDESNINAMLLVSYREKSALQNDVKIVNDSGVSIAQASDDISEPDNNFHSCSSSEERENAKIMAYVFEENSL